MKSKKFVSEILTVRVPARRLYRDGDYYVCGSAAEWLLGKPPCARKSYRLEISSTPMPRSRRVFISRGCALGYWCSSRSEPTRLMYTRLEDDLFGSDLNITSSAKRFYARLVVSK